MFCRLLVLDSFQNNEGTIFNFMPFKFDGYFEKPSTFYIDFITDGIEYEYSFSITRNEILTEELYYYPNKRKVKISFERPFEIITPIESYKKYNILLGMPRDENFMNGKLGECQCCSLF